MEEKARRGRPPYTATDKERKQISMMVGLGLTQTQIGSIMGVSQDTLDRHHREDLDNGVAKANMQVANNLFTIATSSGQGAVAAAIFWMKTRAKWRETTHMEHTGADGGPIKTEARIDVSQMTEAERVALASAIGKAGAALKDED